MRRLQWFGHSQRTDDSQLTVNLCRKTSSYSMYSAGVQYVGSGVRRGDERGVAGGGRDRGLEPPVRSPAPLSP